MTRCSGSSGGTSVPVRSAIVFRRAFRSTCWSCSALRVSRSNAAGCRNGNTSASPSSPSTSLAVRDRAVGVRGERGGHEQLRSVGMHRTGGRADLRGSEVGERRRPIGPHDQRVPAHVPVRDALLVEPGEGMPVTAEELVADVVGGERDEGASARIEDEERVALVGLARRDRRHHRNAGSLGGQREERLVLHLLEPAGADVLRAAVPDRVPGGRDELPVRGIPSEHLDEERLSIGRGGEGERHAPRLERSVAGRGRVDTELVEQRRQLIEREAAAG